MICALMSTKLDEDNTINHTINLLLIHLKAKIILLMKWIIKIFVYKSAKNWIHLPLIIKIKILKTIYIYMSIKNKIY